MVMHLGRDGGSDVKVEDVVDIARAAGHVIMEVYRSDSEVRAVRDKYQSPCKNAAESALIARSTCFFVFFSQQVASSYSW